MKDQVQTFQLEKTSARGRIVQLDTLIKDISGPHNYPPLVNKFMWELIALGILISDMFKFKGFFTLQTISDGPISTLVVDITSDKHVRACARFNKKAITKIEAASVPRVLGAGYLAFTIDQEHEKDRFQGMVELTGKTLSECVHHYFRQSEQIEVGVRVATAEADGNRVSAAGILIQQMPDISQHSEEDREDDWLRIMSLLGTLSKEELLSADHTLTDILYNLFWEDGVRVFDPKPLIAKCRCSEEKTIAMLKTFPQDDLLHMLHDHMIEVTCEFCSKQYRYNEAEVKAWIVERESI